MNITIQIPDDAVGYMMSTGRRISGSLCLVNANEGNFHPWKRSCTCADGATDPNQAIIMLRCGKAVVCKSRMSLRLQLQRDSVRYPVTTIAEDCEEARAFFKEYCN